MDISGLATDLSNAKLGQQIQTAVLKKSLDAAKQQGAAAVQLIETAAKISDQAPAPSSNGRLDVRG